MPDAVMASMTSPEQGAQQECINTFLRLSGSCRTGRLLVVIRNLVCERVLIRLDHHFIEFI